MLELTSHLKLIAFKTLLTFIGLVLAPNRLKERGLMVLTNFSWSDPHLIIGLVIPFSHATRFCLSSGEIVLVAPF